MIKQRIICSRLYIAPLMLLSGVIMAYGDKFETAGPPKYIETDRSATENPIKDYNGQTCALIKLEIPKGNDDVISGDHVFDKKYHGNEWWIYMPPGTSTFFIKYPGYETLTVKFEEKGGGYKSGGTYRLTIKNPPLCPTNTPYLTQNSNANIIPGETSMPSNAAQHQVSADKTNAYIDPSSFYILAGYQILGISGVNVGLGGYINNFNIEANFLYGLSKSETIFWNDLSGEARPIEATYSPISFNMMAGYGFKVMNRMRITPRCGFQYTILTESANIKIANNANTYGMPIGAKVDFAIAKHFGISVEPSYLITIGKSKGYQKLADISKDIKDFGNGFGLNVSINLNF